MQPVCIDIEQLQALLARHLPVYRRRIPHYQAHMLASLSEVWLDSATQLLDVGGGTGVMAEAMARFLPVDRVCSVDVADRFCQGLGVQTRTYDGTTLPFADASHDAATLNNVLHHVPVHARAGLLREIRRVVNGPLYVKDHVRVGWLDDLRLAALDTMGNLPFGGMWAASYLSADDWARLAASSGWRIAAWASPRSYRKGLAAAWAPNRLEVTFRLERA